MYYIIIKLFCRIIYNKDVFPRRRVFLVINGPDESVGRGNLT